MKSIRSGVLSAERGGKLVDLDLAHADVEVELDRAGALVTVHDLLVRHRDAVVDHPEEVRLAGAHPRGDLDLHARGQLDGEVAEARSEERRVGKECGSTGRYRWSPFH